MRYQRQHKTTPSDCIIFGKHTIDLALERRPDTLKVIYLSERFTDERIVAKIRRLDIPVRLLDERKFSKQVPAGANHQGVVAEIRIDALLENYQHYIKNAPITEDSLFLILSEIQDPQNVGAIIRSAAAFGAQAVFVPTHQQAPITGTVAKVSAGMIFTLPIVQIKNINTTISDLQQRAVRVYGLAGEGDASIHTVAFNTASALVVGNEGRGLREKTRSLCDTLVSIPTHPRCESLNAAASVAVGASIWSSQHQSVVK